MEKYLYYATYSTEIISIPPLPLSHRPTPAPPGPFLNSRVTECDFRKYIY